MSEIKQIIHRELSGVLPVYLIKDIAQRITKALEREEIILHSTLQASYKRVKGGASE